MKEFIKRWSNWWILNPKRKQLDDAFEKELNELIEREVALRIHDVSGQREQFYCTCSRAKGLDHDEDGKAYCIDCGKYLEQTIP